jgi:hypothetical protein
LTAPDTLAEVGQWLYGDDWRRELVHKLDVQPRRVRAWASGKEPVPAGVWRELYEALRQNQVEIARLSYAVMTILHPDVEAEGERIKAEIRRKAGVPATAAEFMRSIKR